MIVEYTKEKREYIRNAIVYYLYINGIPTDKKLRDYIRRPVKEACMEAQRMCLVNQELNLMTNALLDAIDSLLLEGKRRDRDN